MTDCNTKRAVPSGLRDALRQGTCLLRRHPLLFLGQALLLESLSLGYWAIERVLWDDRILMMAALLAARACLGLLYLGFLRGLWLAYQGESPHFGHLFWGVRHVSTFWLLVLILLAWHFAQYLLYQRLAPLQGFGDVLGGLLGAYAYWVVHTGVVLFACAIAASQTSGFMATARMAATFFRRGRQRWLLMVPVIGAFWAVAYVATQGIELGEVVVDPGAASMLALATAYGLAAVLTAWVASWMIVVMGTLPPVPVERNA